MTHTIGIIGAGAMGSAVAKRLTSNGWTVLTVMQGRSLSTIARAKAAGMTIADPEDLQRAKLILSIIPPNVTKNAAAELAPILGAATTPPIYVDCNAIRPDLSKEIAEVTAAHNVDFVDGGIIGGIPSEAYAGPTFYISGPRADGVMMLNEGGIVTKNLGTEIGSASAIKMSYGGITKGHIAIGAAMLLAADRAGVKNALLAEMALSQNAFLKGYQRSIPDMFAKSYRWVPEMQEISDFLGSDRAEANIWKALAAFYTQMADDFDGSKEDIGKLTDVIEAAKVATADT